MNYVNIKNKKYQLIGEIVAKGHTLEFKATNIKNHEVSNKKMPGIKIISVFPDINTRICDQQTLEINYLAKQYPQIKFISITNDNVTTINKWCHAKNVNNLEIWSDLKLGQFANKTNALIPKIHKLARGLIVLNNDNKIVAIEFNNEVAREVNWNVIKPYLK